MKVKDFEERVELPPGVSAEVAHGTIKIKGPKGEVSKRMIARNVKVEKRDNSVVISVTDATKRDKKMLYTFYAHIANMVHGVVTPYVYKLKVLSGHFPMNVMVQSGMLSVKNFLGEKIPRTVKLKPGVSVKVEGQIINVEGPDKDLVSQVAADIEQLMRITNRDRRVFQDGIFIIDRAGKEI